MTRFMSMRRYAFAARDRERLGERERVLVQRAADDDALDARRR